MIFGKISDHGSPKGSWGGSEKWRGKNKPLVCIEGNASLRSRQWKIVFDMKRNEFEGRVNRKRHGKLVKLGQKKIIYKPVVK